MSITHSTLVQNPTAWIKYNVEDRKVSNGMYNSYNIIFMVLTCKHKNWLAAQYSMSEGTKLRCKVVQHLKYVKGGF